MRQLTGLVILSCLISFPIIIRDSGILVSYGQRGPLSRFTKDYDDSIGFRQPDFYLIAYAVADPGVTIRVEGNYRIIRSDGMPDHSTGQFPNRGNPNAVTPQRYEFRMPLRPRPSGRITPLGIWPFGIALNGIPFDPNDSEYWNNDPRSGWQYELLSRAVQLGFDRDNAHVKPNGSYHYHGLPYDLLEQYQYQSKPVLIGYAADGYPIYGPYGYLEANSARSGVIKLRTSFRIRQGERSKGPDGRHDGMFIRDYEYVHGLGDLDTCNGRTGVTPEYPSGTYHYVITDSFPYIPRCFKGTPDPSFSQSQFPK
jgi:hypothetical protein